MYILWEATNTLAVTRQQIKTKPDWVNMGLQPEGEKIDQILGN